MKDRKSILGIISVVVLVVAACATVFLFREQIRDFLCDVKEKLPCGKKKFTSEEFEDFADI